MKKALEVAVVRDNWGRLELLTVTTRKPSGRVWGRHPETHEPTNRAARDVFARYDTEENAQAAMARITAARESFKAQIEAAQRATRDLERQRDAAVDLAADGPGKLA